MVNGVCILSASILGIYETQTMILPIRPKMQAFLTSASGPFNSLWILGNAFNKYPENFKSLLVNQPEMRKLLNAQSALSLTELLVCLTVVIKTSRGQALHGIAVNGLIFNTV